VDTVRMQEGAAPAVGESPACTACGAQAEGKGAPARARAGLAGRCWAACRSLRRCAERARSTWSTGRPSFGAARCSEMRHSRACTHGGLRKPWTRTRVQGSKNMSQKAMLLSYESNISHTHNAIRPKEGAAAHLDHAERELNRHSAGPPWRALLSTVWLSTDQRTMSCTYLMLLRTQGCAKGKSTVAYSACRGRGNKLPVFPNNEANSMSGASERAVSPGARYKRKDVHTGSQLVRGAPWRLQASNQSMLRTHLSAIGIPSCRRLRGLHTAKARSALERGMACGLLASARPLPWPCLLQLHIGTF